MPQRGWAVGYLRTSSGDERVVGLERVDRHVLRAVVLEHAVDVRRAADQQQVADEDHDPDQALDEVLDDVVLDVAGRERGHDERQDEEQPDAEDGGDAEHQRDAALADLDALVLGLEARAADEPAGADDQRLVEDDEPAHERPLGGATCRGSRCRAFRGVDDPAVGMTEGDGDRRRGRAS